MGMNHQKTPRLKPFLDKVPPGFLVDAAWLKKQGGIDSKSIQGYVERGWLERIVRGVYRRPLPERARKPTDADWQVPLLSLQWVMNKNVHLGGKAHSTLLATPITFHLGIDPALIFMAMCLRG